MAATRPIYAGAGHRRRSARYCTLGAVDAAAANPIRREGGRSRPLSGPALGTRARVLPLSLRLHACVHANNAMPQFNAGICFAARIMFHLITDRFLIILIFLFYPWAPIELVYLSSKNIIVLNLTLHSTNPQACAHTFYPLQWVKRACKHLLTLIHSFAFIPPSNPSYSSENRRSRHAPYRLFPFIFLRYYV